MNPSGSNIASPYARTQRTDLFFPISRFVAGLFRVDLTPGFYTYPASSAGHLFLRREETDLCNYNLEPADVTFDVRVHPYICGVRLTDDL